MSKRLRKLAEAAGAKTEADFALYGMIDGKRNGFAEMVEDSKDGPGHLSGPWRGMLYLYEILLERGRFYEPQPKPERYPAGKVKQCYANSQRLARKDKALTYCEGLAVMLLGGDRTVDIEHAFCVADGKVIDVTLTEPGLSYFGISFNPATVKAAAGYGRVLEMLILERGNASK